MLSVDLLFHLVVGPQRGLLSQLQLLARVPNPFAQVVWAYTFTSEVLCLKPAIGQSWDN